jgi:predicted alpha-1,6-mannanase (GH76 family)
MAFWTTVRITKPLCKFFLYHHVSCPLTLHSWSYNQGVVLGGLVELNRAAPNDTYLPSANKIAKAAIETLADSNNIIHETCEPQCLPDGTQFKGIFIRNLGILQAASPNSIYSNVISSCANSIWDNDRNEKSQFGINWAGPIEAVVDASTHSSAFDALVAALAEIGA